MLGYSYISVSTGWKQLASPSSGKQAYTQPSVSTTCFSFKSRREKSNLSGLNANLTSTNKLNLKFSMPHTTLGPGCNSVVIKLRILSIYAAGNPSMVATWLPSCFFWLLKPWFAATTGLQSYYLTSFKSEKFGLKPYGKLIFIQAHCHSHTSKVFPFGLQTNTGLKKAWPLSAQYNGLSLAVKMVVNKARYSVTISGTWPYYISESNFYSYSKSSHHPFNCLTGNPSLTGEIFGKLMGFPPSICIKAHLKGVSEAHSVRS